MSQISSLSASPDPDAHITPASARTATQKNLASPGSGSPTDTAQTSSLPAQLTRLNSVLNSLQTNATATRATYTEAFNKVKSGTYQVDALHVSRSIVNESISRR